MKLRPSQIYPHHSRQEIYRIVEDLGCVIVGFHSPQEGECFLTTETLTRYTCTYNCRDDPSYYRLILRPKP